MVGLHLVASSSSNSWDPLPNHHQFLYQHCTNMNKVKKSGDIRIVLYKSTYLSVISIESLYRYIYIHNMYIYIWYTDHGFDISMFHPEEPTKWTSLFPNISPNLSPHHSQGTEHFFRWICLLRHGIQESTNLVFKDLKREIWCSIF